MARIQQMNEHRSSAAGSADRKVSRLDLRFRLNVAYADRDEAKCLALMDELDRSFDECRNPLFTAPEIAAENIDSMEPLPT